MNLDLSSLKQVFALLAPVLLVAGIVDMLPTGFDIPISASHMLLASIGCYMANKA